MHVFRVAQTSALVATALLSRTGVADTVQSPCTVELVPADTLPAWRAAADEVRARLDGPGEHDCRDIVVHVTLSGAVVAFTTRSGRQAVRQITAPGELDSTVAALLVAPPIAVSAAGAAGAAGAESEASAASAASMDGASAPVATTTPAVRPAGDRAPLQLAPPSADPAGFLLGLTLGARIGGPGAFQTPVLGAFAAVMVRRWEIGVQGQWETGYTSQANLLPSNVHMSAVAAGVYVGRREPLGNLVSLVFGGHLGGAIMNEEADVQPDGVGGAQAEARVGAYLGVVLPARATFRFRPQLSGEIVPSRLTRNSELDPALPSPPKWSVGLSLSLETVAL